MNWVDILIIVLIAGPGFMGWRTGVIKWAVTLAGAISGIYLAGGIYTKVADFLPQAGSYSEATHQAISFGLVFVVVLIAAWALGKFLRTLLTTLFLNWIDNFAGLCLGALVGAVTATALISAIGIVPIDSLQGSISESDLAKPLIARLGFILNLLPDQFDAIKDLVNRDADLLKTILDRANP
jgi:uncharacterized membrane protein required for colicin V production